MNRALYNLEFKVMPLVFHPRYLLQGACARHSDAIVPRRAPRTLIPVATATATAHAIAIAIAIATGKNLQHGKMGHGTILTQCHHHYQYQDKRQYQ